jgi:hypothetical protein
MIPSEEFLRHGAECEYMSRFSHDAVSRVESHGREMGSVRFARFEREQKAPLVFETAQVTTAMPASKETGYSIATSPYLANGPEPGASG